MSPEDYESVDTVLMFGADSTESCVDIHIGNDSVVERTEIFRVILEGPPGLDDSVPLSPTQGVIAIINDISLKIFKMITTHVPQPPL